MGNWQIFINWVDRWLNRLWRFMSRADIWMLRGIAIGIVGVIIIQVWVV